MNQNCDIASKIFNTLSFTDRELDILNSKFEKITVKKGDIILEANEIVTDQYYVLSGCLRSFFIDSQAKEHTLQFAIEDWWASDFTAFFDTSKSILNIECIQDAVLYRLSKNDIDYIFEHFPQIESFIRKKLEKAFAGFQKRILGNLSKTAKERYVDFITKYPNIEQNIKNYHIASYLGITKESLSRIRKELVKKQ